MDSNFRKRIKRRLYYGDMADLDTPSLPLTELTVEYFRESVPQELGRIDLEVASDLVRKNRVSPCSTVTSLLYAKKLRQSNKPYLESISSSDVFFISMMMASKYLYDEGVDEEVYNDEWADSFDQEVDDVNQMETDFLQAMDWGLFVRPEEFESILADIERRLALREGVRRGWFTYAELSVLADWNLFTQLWNNVGLECTKLSVIMSATYVTSLLSLLGTTAFAIQVSGPLSTAVVTGVTDHVLPAVVSGWSALPHYLPPLDMEFTLKNDAFEKLSLDFPFKENQSGTNQHDGTGHGQVVSEKLNLSTEEDLANKDDVQASGRSPSLLSILFLDSLLSQIWSVQYGNGSRQRAKEKHEEYHFSQDEHHKRKGERARGSCRRNQTYGSDFLAAPAPTVNSDTKPLPMLLDVRTDALNADLELSYRPTTCSVVLEQTGGVRRRKDCVCSAHKSDELYVDYNLRHKVNADVPLSLIMDSHFLNVGQNFHAGFRTDVKIT